MPPSKPAPPSADPRPGHNAGYAEPQPRSPGQARDPAGSDRDREDGGLRRETGADPNPAADDD